MFLDLHQKPILTHKLVMTPQLQQAIKLLQLSRVELAETIRHELEENPALEEAGEPKAEDGIDDLSSLQEYLNPYDRSKATPQTEAREFDGFETYTAARETLTDHLLQQLLLTSPTAEEEKIGCLIAGSLNKDGYLAVSVDEISEMSDCEPEEVERVLALMQTFDPPGVCARGLRESLLLQIERSGAENPLAGEIIAGHLEDLARNDYRSISKTLRIDLEDVDPKKDDLRIRGFEKGGALFASGEGMDYFEGTVYFDCTNGGPIKAGQIWRYVPSLHEGTEKEGDSPGKLELFVEIRDRNIGENPDQMTGTLWGDVFVCEDGFGEQYLLGITPKGKIYRLARNAKDESEFAGVCFSPDGSTVFVNYLNAGLTFAITGPWKSRTGVKP